MLCTFCNAARLANEAPCPQCGAPSPIAGGVNSPYGATMSPPTASAWGGQPSPFSHAQSNNWGQQGWPETPQNPPFSNAQSNTWGQQGWPETPQVPPFSNAQTNTWGQQAWPGAAQIPQQTQTQQQPSSTLPVPYQGQQSLQVMHPGALAGGNARLPAPVPMQSMAELVAALPEDAGAIYVPPMYTKPRPIIPRYRVISGLLSVLIVTLFLCGGVGYYAKASGKLTALGQFSGLVPPPNVRPAAPTPLAVPKVTQVTGPAYGTINSATTTSSLNSQNVATQQDIIFKPGQTIFLVYSVQHPAAPGVVLVKWYSNGLFYQSSVPEAIKTATRVTTSQEYIQPAEGMVELYWNNQLAIRLYFVVR